MIRISRFYLLMGFLVYLPFENAIWTYLLPSLFVYGKAMTELIIIVYGLFVYISTINMQINRYTKLDLFLVLFGFIYACSVLINKTPIIEALLTIRPIVRFYFVFIIARSISWTDQRVSFLLNALIISGVLQAGISILAAMFSPIENMIVTARIRELGADEFIRQLATEKSGAIFGLFDVAAHFGYFMLICFVAAFSKFLSQRKTEKGFLYLIATIVISVAIILAMKRLPMILATLFAIGLLTHKLDRPSRLVAFFLAIVVSSLASLFIATSSTSFNLGGENYTSREIRSAEGVSLTNQMLELTSGDYWRNSFEGSRGWWLISSINHYIGHFRILGYGPYQERVMAQMYSEDPSTFYRFGQNKYSGAFKDVYLIAIWAFIGPIGAGLILFHCSLCLLKSYKLTHTKFNLPSSETYLYLSVFLVTCLALFVVRIYEFKTFSFLIWLTTGMISERLWSLKSSYKQKLKSGSVNDLQNFSHATA